MKKNIFRYLYDKKIYHTEHVNKIIVNSFLRYNKITSEKNSLIVSYIVVNEEDSDYIHSSNIIEIINKHNSSFTLEDLIQFFEFVISPAERKVTGAVYTPRNIRQYIVKKSFLHNTKCLSSIKLADISCGCAAFLWDSAQHIHRTSNYSFKYIFKNNIFGLDIEEHSVKRAKILLSLAAILNGEDDDFDFNIFLGNALTYNWYEKYISFHGFDIIVGNPPYVCSRHLSDETKKILLSFDSCRSGHPDLYIPFFQIGIENLATDGILGLITMNSFFKSLNCRALRKYFNKKSLDFRIIDFGSEQVFKSKNTYTCVCFIVNANSANVKYAAARTSDLSDDSIKYEQITYSRLNDFHGWNLKNNYIIEQIEATGRRFGDIYKTSHGLATLKNDIYIFNPNSEDELYYYIHKGVEYKIEKGICKDIINSNKLSRRFSFDELKEKLIFPYTDEKKPVLFEESYFRNTFPYAYNYLTCKRSILAMRDKGNRNYAQWYAFGRTQALEKRKYKLFFPKYSNSIPYYILNSDQNTYFYNGQAVIGNSIEDLVVIKKIMESRLFWFYIRTTSKPYTSNYFSLNGMYINNFGVCDLTNEERAYVLSEDNKVKLDSFFDNKYNMKADYYLHNI